jgi:hypothetical protein
VKVPGARAGPTNARYDPGPLGPGAPRRTGGYGYTFEIGPHELHPPFPEVVDEYLGAGHYAGKGNREAFLVALENAADAGHHSVIAGKTSQVDEFGNPRVIGDTLESTLTVPPGNRYTWHVNPSTRPEMMEHRVRLLADEPTRAETTTKTAVVWLPGDDVDVPFSMPETGADSTSGPSFSVRNQYAPARGRSPIS